MKSRVCAKCKERKPLVRFDVAPNCKDGRRATCRTCREAYRVPVKVLEPPRYTRELKAKRYLITSAQNNTRVHAGFWESLKVAAEHHTAEIVVVPFRYKNPSGLAPGKDLRPCGLQLGKAEHETCARYVNHEGKCSLVKDSEHELWFDPALEPYLINVRKKLCPNLVLAADVKIQPTAAMPLSGFEGLTGSESCIIGHPKMQYDVVASGDWPKILTTTGAVTQRNYSNTKAGALGEFHHYLGALIVEIEDSGIFHVRQLNAQRHDGAFFDLDLVFTATGVEAAPPAASVTLGDIHDRCKDLDVDAATHGPGGIVETLDPEFIFAHDLSDGETHNPHDRDDVFIRMARGEAGRLDVRAELKDAVQFMNERTRGRKGVIVASNHHDFLRRWILSTNWKELDKSNAKFYLETALAMTLSTRMDGNDPSYVDAFAHWMKELGLKSNIQVLSSKQSFKIKGIEHAWHGHFGPNGSKGTKRNLARLGTKVNSGHSHTPCIFEGHYKSGTSSGRHQHYHRGPGSNLNTHIVTYANGARALITVIGNRWRA